MELSAVAKVLGGKKILRRTLQSRMDLVNLSNEGMPKDALIYLANYLSFSISQMSKLLPVTERTIQRYGASKHFNRVVSEHVLQIAEVAAKGSEVFGSRDQFLRWMNHPNKSLNEKIPVSLLSSKFGSDMILDELGRMDHGVLA